MDALTVDFEVAHGRRHRMHFARDERVAQAGARRPELEPRDVLPDAVSVEPEYNAGIVICR
jgi:hypothetical protein